MEYRDVLGVILVAVILAMLTMFYIAHSKANRCERRLAAIDEIANMCQEEGRYD